MTQNNFLAPTRKSQVQVLAYIYINLKYKSNEKIQTFKCNIEEFKLGIYLNTDNKIY